MLQGETSPGVFGSMPSLPIDFVLNVNRTPRSATTTSRTAARGCVFRMRACTAMAGIRTYRDGALIDDATTTT